MPRFFNTEEATDWASRTGVLRIDADNCIAISLSALR
jgi:hypothetical protein